MRGSSGSRLLGTLEFAQSKRRVARRTQLSARRTGRAEERAPGSQPAGRRRRPPRHPTTSFLTATTLIYAIGAGITAAAGTRLALQ